MFSTPLLLLPSSLRLFLAKEALTIKYAGTYYYIYSHCVVNYTFKLHSKISLLSFSAFYTSFFFINGDLNKYLSK